MENKRNLIANAAHDFEPDLCAVRDTEGDHTIRMGLGNQMNQHIPWSERLCCCWVDNTEKDPEVREH